MKTRRGGVKWRAALASMLGISSGLASTSRHTGSLSDESENQNYLLKQLQARPNYYESHPSEPIRPARVPMFPEERLSLRTIDDYDALKGKVKLFYGYFDSIEGLRKSLGSITYTENKNEFRFENGSGVYAIMHVKKSHKSDGDIRYDLEIVKPNETDLIFSLMTILFTFGTIYATVLGNRGIRHIRNQHHQAIMQQQLAQFPHFQHLGTLGMAAGGTRNTRRGVGAGTRRVKKKWVKN
jgi:hypothetical protein